MLLTSNSRENQDIICVCLFGGKKNGTYLEVGASQPVTDSNTFLLETAFDWKGVSIEIDGHLVNMFNHKRKNKCLCLDATTANYDEIITNNYETNHIDFLQLDTDPPHNTLKVLKAIDFNKFSFSFITFEHDLYNGGMNERTESRQILETYGYTRFFSDVKHGDKVFEDWYINESKIHLQNWKQLQYDNTNMNTQNMPQEVKNKIDSMLHNLGYSF